MQEKLFDAAELGSYNDLKDLLDKTKNPYPLDLNSRGLDGWTALHFASNEGHLKIVNLLLKNEVIF